MRKKILKAVSTAISYFMGLLLLVACEQQSHEFYVSSPSVRCSGNGDYRAAAMVIDRIAARAETENLEFSLFGRRSDATEEPYWVIVYFSTSMLYAATGFEGEGGWANLYRHRELSEAEDDQILQLAGDYLGAEFECVEVSHEH